MPVTFDAADQVRATRFVERGGKVCHVHPSPRSLGDLDDLRAALAPRQDVGVMLIRSDHDDDPLAAADPCRDLKQANQPVDRTGCAGAREQDMAVRAAADEAMDRGPGLLPHAGHRGPAERGFRMAVGVERQDPLADEGFDLPQRPARSDIVCIEQRLHSERGLESDPVTDKAGPHGRDRIRTVEARPKLGEGRRLHAGERDGVHRLVS